MQVPVTSLIRVVQLGIAGDCASMGFLGLVHHGPCCRGHTKKDGCDLMSRRGGVEALVKVAPSLASVC